MVVAQKMVAQRLRSGCDGIPQIEVDRRRSRLGAGVHAKRHAVSRYPMKVRDNRTVTADYGVASVK